MSETRGGAMNDSGKMDMQEILRVELQVLRREHRDLDDSIAALQVAQRADQLQLGRLKRRKLALKDKIRQIENRLFPDIIA